MGLEQDAVDLFEIDAFGLVAHGFEQTGQAQVAGATQEAVGGTDNEGESFLRKSVVGEADGVELGEDELMDLIGVEPGDDDRKGDAGLDVLVDAEVEIGQERGLADQNQVVILGEVFEQQPQFAQAGHFHEMGVVDDGSNHHAEMVEAEHRGVHFLQKGEPFLMAMAWGGMGQHFARQIVERGKERHGPVAVIVVGAGAENWRHG